MFQQDEDAANGFERISFLLIRYSVLEDGLFSAEFHDPRYIAPELLIPYISISSRYSYKELY